MNYTQTDYKWFSYISPTKITDSINIRPYRRFDKNVYHNIISEKISKEDINNKECLVELDCLLESMLNTEKEKKVSHDENKEIIQIFHFDIEDLIL